MRRLWSGLRLLLVLAVSAAVAVIAGRWEVARQLYGPGPAQITTTIVVPRGSGTPAIGQSLQAAGVVRNWRVFEIAAMAIDTGGPLQAGEYAFLPGESLHEILRQLRDGRTVVHRLTVPEGLGIAEIMAIVGNEPALSGPLGAASPEGSLMPDTYNFSLGALRTDMIGRMRRAMDKSLAEAWAGRASGLALPTPAAALTLASIVEKESAIPAERPKVAAVFLNRLARGMKLQADPTVIYALTDGKAPLGRPLSHADLAIDSPFNSYRYDGLPPTPIDCPGRGAIAAVMHPDSTPALYFVADGSGAHVFADNLEDHNRNVARLRLLEQGAAGARN